MSEHTTTLDAGDLGTLDLIWDMRWLSWEPADPSSGYPVGQWQGTPVLIGCELDGRPLLPMLIAEVIGHERLLRLSDEAREDWPSPRQQAAERRQDERAGA